VHPTYNYFIWSKAGLSNLSSGTKTQSYQHKKILFRDYEIGTIDKRDRSDAKSSTLYNPRNLTHIDFLRRWLYVLVLELKLDRPDSKLFLDFQIDLQIQKKFTEKTALLKS